MAAFLHSKAEVSVIPDRSTVRTGDEHTPHPAPQQLRNIRTIAELEANYRARLSSVDRFIDKLAKVVSRPAFVMAHVAWFGIWIVVNRGPRAFDPFPFSLLTLAVSLEAILLSGFLLIAQSRMSAYAERRAALELQINLLAEQELTAILRALAKLAERAGIDLRASDPWFHELQSDTHLEHLDALINKDDGAGV